MGPKSNAADPARPHFGPMSSNLYFAYGSNLCVARLVARAPSARAIGAARALGFALRLDKRGADGTAKANLHAAPDGAVWGAVYEIDPADWPSLDACERDYARLEIDVERGAQRLRVQTYRSDHLIADALAADWYAQLILDGAREHALPAEWCAELERLAAR
jgi:AIG2 family protein